MNNKLMDSRKITYVAIGVAAMLVGGYFLFQISMVFAIPGSKYIIMSPYLSMIIFILLSKTKNSSTVLYVGIVFGFIMGLIHLFMGVAIVMTAILTHMSIILIRNEKVQAQVGAVLFSGYMGITALGISKFLVGGAFSYISNKWIISIGIFCLLLGLIGTMMAKKMMIYINVGTAEKSM